MGRVLTFKKAPDVCPTAVDNCGGAIYDELAHTGERLYAMLACDDVVGVVLWMVSTLPG